MVVFLSNDTVESFLNFITSFTEFGEYLLSPFTKINLKKTRMTTFNVYQPQNHQSSSQIGRGIKRLKVSIDTESGAITSNELNPLWSEWPFTGRPALSESNLFVSCACEGFTGIQSYDLASGQIVKQIPLDNTQDLIYSASIFDFYNSMPQGFQSNYRKIGLICIDPYIGINWNVDVLEGYSCFRAGFYSNVEDNIILVGLINNSVFSISAFNTINGSSIPVTNDNFNFSSNIHVARVNNNVGFIVSYNENSIVFAKYEIDRDSQTQMPIRITITNLQKSYAFNGSNNPVVTKYDQANGWITVYTINQQGEFLKIILYLSTYEIPNGKIINTNQQGAPYQMAIRTSKVNDIDQDVVFVARTSSDTTTQNIVLIPNLTNPVISYFGDNIDALGFAVQ